ncbi:hypothetical protein [Nostoc sp. UHCC 0870]|uniref:hypothetical protein n=1 Tax=Nostoc sp. UHCC 0870 TaxID=2914041 RepID=UPI001EDFEBBF|nr:hypothetical protein [Nostoc sp. UHCC 0870]UKO96749.1 hypothetical protein L6494_19335 [Nostoc sp. UHCC 0870]
MGIGNRELGIGNWGLGIGDCLLTSKGFSSPTPLHPYTPTPLHPHTPTPSIQTDH